MSFIHWFSIAGVVIAVALFAAGFSEMAGLALGVAAAIEILGPVFSGRGK